LDQTGEDRVQQAQVAARDQDEAEHDAGQRGQRLSVGPLDPLELGPASDQELYETRAVLGLRLLLARAAPARGVPLLGLGLRFVVDLVVLEVLVLVELGLVLDDGVGAALVLRRRADGERRIDPGGRLGGAGVVDVRDGGRAVGLGRTGLPAVRLLAGVALLLQAARAALRLPLFRPLAIPRHRSLLLTRTRARDLRHQRVSLCGVWRPHQRQYLRNSIRSGSFRLDFSVW
jgi:hypothetical protein